MRICLISREFPPETGWGGIATFVHDLALGLREVGQEVEVIALSADGKDSVVDYEGIKLHRVAPKVSLEKYQMFLSVMPYSHSLVKALWALHTKFLELHSKTPFDVVEVPEMFGEGCFLALSKQVPLVVRLYTPHFKFMDDKLHLINDEFDHQFLAMLEKFTLLNADIVTSPSADLGDYVKAAVRLSDEEMPVIRGLVNTKRFAPDGERALPKRDEDGYLKIIFVGRLEERKGVYQLCRAIQDVVKNSPKTRFYLIGKDTNTAPGGGSVQKELEEILNQTGAAQHVIFTGPVPHADMPKYFRSADIFCLPSLYDNAPLTCLEAISSGTALVGTSSGGMKEYVVNGESGTIIPPGDEKALATALTDLLNDDEKRLSYGTKARQRALELYSREITAKKSIELYHLAKSNFQARSRYALYRKDDDLLLDDLETIMQKFDSMIYQLVYKRSLRFRLSYWWHMLKARPKLALAVFAARLGLGTARLLGQKQLPPQLEQLEKFEQQLSGPGPKN